MNSPCAGVTFEPADHFSLSGPDGQAGLWCFSRCYPKARIRWRPNRCSLPQQVGSANRSPAAKSRKLLFHLAAAQRRPRPRPRWHLFLKRYLPVIQLFLSWGLINRRKDEYTKKPSGFRNKQENMMTSPINPNEVGAYRSAPRPAPIPRRQTVAANHFRCGSKCGLVHRRSPPEHASAPAPPDDADPVGLLLCRGCYESRDLELAIQTDRTVRYIPPTVILIGWTSGDSGADTGL